jgi:hypothetical protein
MFDFDKAVLGDHAIPLREAADFFIGIKQAAAEKVRASREELVDAGEQRAVSNMAAEFEREKARRAERLLGTVGSVGGALGGGALAHHVGGGNPLATLGGAGLGYLAGGKAGRELGTEVDAARFKSAAARMRSKLAALKIADEVGAQEAPMAAPTGGQELMPSNYLAAETIGAQAQEQTESAFYRQRAQQAEQTAAAAQSQMDALQQQLGQLQEQAAQTSTQVQDSMNQALAAQDEALKQTQVAANMRLGIQKLRAQMMEVASQDPAEVAAQELQAGAAGQAQPGQDPNAQGPAGQAPGAEAAATSMPADGAPQATAPAGGTDPSTASPTSASKQAALRLSPGMVAGAAGGAALGVLDSRRTAGKLPERQQKLDALSAQEGGFAHAFRVALAKKDVADSEFARNDPWGHGALGAAKGAIVGGGLANRMSGALRGIQNAGIRGLNV